MARTPLLVLIPGLGVDWRIAAPQRQAFGEDLVIPPWLTPGRREALGVYARRWGAQLRAELPGDRPVVLAGMSFGGMVAQEMASVLRPVRLMLIGTARSRGEVRRVFRWLEPVTRPVPAGLVRPMLPAMGWVMAELERMGPAERAVVREVVAHADPVLAKWSAWACVHWRDWPMTEAEIGCTVERVHGNRDWLIPFHGADMVVPGGRHLIHLTHAGIVNAFLGRGMNGR